jgi:hypothetical protein
MRALSNACLHLAYFARKFPRLVDFFIATGIKVRKFERRRFPDEQVFRDYAARLNAEEKAAFYARIEAAVRKHQDELNAAPAYCDEVISEQAFNSFFERSLMNGNFKITPTVRKIVREGVRQRRSNGLRGRMIVVANKTNTAVSLGKGQIGDVGGVLIPKPVDGEVEPFFLTDHGTATEWLHSADFRSAIAKGWIALLPTTGR